MAKILTSYNNLHLWRKNLFENCHWSTTAWTCCLQTNLILCFSSPKRALGPSFLILTLNSGLALKAVLRRVRSRAAGIWRAMASTGGTRSARLAASSSTKETKVVKLPAADTSVSSSSANSKPTTRREVLVRQPSYCKILDDLKGTEAKVANLKEETIEVSNSSLLWMPMLNESDMTHLSGINFSGFGFGRISGHPTSTNNYD